MPDPKEFSCMDDHDNNGWGNSLIRREESLQDIYDGNEMRADDWDEEEQQPEPQEKD